MKKTKPAIRSGFTLIELLVVIAIIGMLAGILLPTLSKARERANRAACMGNLKVIGEALNTYNIDVGRMPPTVPPNHRATHNIKTAADSIVGLGYFYNDPNLGITTDDYIDDLSVFVCPSSSYIFSGREVANNWNQTPDIDTPTTYIYRAQSGASSLILSDARPAIVMDYNCRTCSEYNHNEEYVNILFKNGNVRGVENILDTDTNPPTTDRILTIESVATTEKNRVFRNADEE